MCIQTEPVVTFSPSLKLDEQPKRRRTRSKKNRNEEYVASSSDSSSGDSSQNSNTTRTSSPKKRNKPKRKRRRSRKTGTNGTLNGVSEEERGLYVALDCEMVGVGPGGYSSALGRVCLVNWNEEIILDTFVKVSEPITDYRTFVSGIRKEDIESEEAMDFDQCRMTLASLLAGKILVGHALKNDLRALQLHHPWYDTRDTAKYEPFMNHCEITGIPKSRKLRDLVKEKLNRNIQIDGEEHSPVEDAVAALNLFQFAKKKWEKVMQYKFDKTRAIEQTHVKCNSDDHYEAQ